MRLALVRVTLVGSVAALSLLVMAPASSAGAKVAMQPPAFPAGRLAEPLLPLPAAARPPDSVLLRPWTGAASLVDAASLARAGTRTRPGFVRGQQPASTSASRNDYAGVSATPGNSTNWSGYIVGTGPYTGVTGTFTVPTLAASTSKTVTSEWVGIGGVAGTGLIQAGVQEVSEPGGDLTTFAWWEVLPAPEIAVPALAVTPW